MEYHRPVLLAESIEGLKIQPSGVYVDATFGGGGHSKTILSRLGDKGHLFAFDQDGDARRNVWAEKRLTFVQCNFRYIAQYMHYYGVGKIQGVLLDLGVSSFMFDNPERGFSYRQDQLLDMRMNKEQRILASDIIAQYSEEKLVGVFSNYGQVRNAKTLAAQICSARKLKKIETVATFLEVIGPWIRGPRLRYCSQVFQSLRIEVNDEMGALQQFLEAVTGLLVPGGRMVVISYHSVEDRMVKHWMRAGNVKGVIQKDDFGKPLSVLTPIVRKPVIPTSEEIENNRRARSAKLRIAEKK